MQDIKDWINGGRNYQAGVALYDQYGDDKQMKRLFCEFRTSFKEKKLLELMRGLLSKGSKAGKLRTKQPAALKEEAGTRHGWPLKMDGPLKALYDDWLLKFKESSSLEARLYDVALAGQKDKNKEIEAGQMAHRILTLRDEIRGQYQERDHYLQHGLFPGRETVFKAVVAGDAKLGERRLLVRRYLTMLKKELAQDDKPNIRLKQEKKWKEFSEEMRYINKKLNRPQNEGIPARNKQVADGQRTD